MRRLLCGLCLLLPLLGVGCATRGPSTYRLSQGVLVPPGVAGPAVARRDIVSGASGGGPCRSADRGIEIRRRGRNVRVTAAREHLAGRPPGWLASWTLALESQGCLATGEGLRLAARIVESLPLDPAAAFRLTHVDDRRSGYLDLGPENRLQVDSPIMREGAPADAPAIESAKINGLTVELKASANLLGFETAWYAIRAKERGVGFAIAPLYSESHIEGKAERQPTPRTNYLRFRPDAGFYRIFYRGDRTIVLLSAPTRVDLERQTEALNKDPNACAGFPAETCVMIPRNVGVNADVVASVNGREIALPVGATVASAIRAAGERAPERILPGLAVTRLFAGKPAAVEFDRASADILSLLLMGNEEISWK
jgi:hypothetical protein